MTIHIRALHMLVASCALGCAHIAHAQDSLKLGTLQSSAAKRDPRTRELDLLSAQSKLKQQNLNTEKLPTLSVEGQTQYQSDVAGLPITLPNGLSIPRQPHDSYDARLVAQQKLFDPSRAPRRALENAQLAESESRIRVALFGVQQNVNELFFASLRVQSQQIELLNGMTDLESQLSAVESRVREGSALPSEALAIKAELIRRRQSVAELNAKRRATMEVLSSLAGVAVDSTSALSTPDLATTVSSARSTLNNVRSRAEYQQFDRTRDLLARQEDARVAQDKPRISAFGRAGYGRPGLNPLNDSFDSYWLVGLQMQWTPWNWRATARDREVIALQRQIVSADEQYFAENVRRSVMDDLATIDRLTSILSSDNELVSLREEILQETRARFSEGVVTSAEFVDKETDVVSARTSRALHRVELAQAQAHFLTMLGIEVR